jgi:type IV fimbrial biogenesis protein FimT
MDYVNMIFFNLTPSIILGKKNSYSKIISGFTIVELLITLAVLSITISIALPNFKTFVANNRIVSQINYFNGAIAQARSESIKIGRRVSMVPVNPNNWANGWDIVLPSNGNEILSHSDAFSGNTILAPGNATPVIQFSDDGRINTLNNIVFTLCNKTRVKADDKAGRELTITPTGVTYLDSKFKCS